MFQKKQFKQDLKRKRMEQLNLSIVEQLLIFRRLLEDVVGADGAVHAGEDTSVNIFIIYFCI